MRVLTRAELTATLAHRQGLITRWNTTPAAAITRLTPLQGQEARAPFVALAARVEGFTRAALERALTERHVVKSTLMRLTLHLASGEDFPAYAALLRHSRMRKWRATDPGVDDEAAELAAWLTTPRTNQDIRAKIEAPDLWTPILRARTLVPLVQLPPAGHYDDRGRDTLFVKDPRPLPTPEDAAKLVLTRYLGAFGPAQKRDVAAWAGAAQRDFDFDALETVRYRDEAGRELLDLAGAEILPGDTPLPPRFLGNWDQPLLAYKDRDRILPPEVLPLKLTLSGDQTLTVGGRVVASWRVDDETMTIAAHTDFPTDGIEAEARRTARFCAPHARAFELVMK
ncbi:AlkZ family DNA glycosylase [Solirubrobacter sp. CPCC 204708]|uniref:Winged helix DNA-binding domain-containing protein n=1 Tax=Solirubrobacter deserti TaxID=2282478 RepID=A0ABT4RHF2_9ACTN|nr:crosslink repair DNA glycosylase YcaQ family protein [Solirubrobacter deserti]MBE2315274.1 AlkZ family DNA glycosylase [Solirubrobacter deserti]MDA0137958.1 winged helix DNA-binding domain-containing protein [Solirubrobacter deserti]